MVSIWKLTWLNAAFLCACFVLVWWLRGHVVTYMDRSLYMYDQRREGFHGEQEHTKNTKSDATVDAVPSVCPTELTTDKSGQVFLYNDQFADVPGINPIQLPELASYTDFMAWMKLRGYRCPYLKAADSA